MRDQQISTLLIDEIMVPQGRELDPETVASMATSIEQLGLLTPIAVFADDEGYRVISGRHRLAAMRSIGKEQIEALVYYDLTDVQIRLSEIVENLHRAELSALQRAEQISEYTKLMWERRKEGGAQVGHHPSNVKGSSGRESGDSAAARDLGISRQAVQRSVTIANIDPAAKGAAKEAGFDDNQQALLKIGAAPKEQQAIIVTELVEKNRAKKARKKCSNSPVTKDVDETVKAIIHNFSVHDIHLIINRLSKAIVPLTDEEESTIVLCDDLEELDLDINLLSAPAL